MTPRTACATRARHIARTLGHYTAARYLARRGMSIEAARFILFGV
jgi:hypothetical protein